MNNKVAGDEGEAKAAAYLENLGYTILTRNFRSSCGEIDIIALEGDCVVFIEVKAWKHYAVDNLELAVTSQKMRRIIETAKFFISVNREYNELSIRFDVIFIQSNGIQHLVEAFTECV